MADTGAVYERDGQSFFDIMYPLENGEWMYVAIRWESLKKVLFDQQVGKRGFIWLIDEAGLIAGDSQNEHNGQSVMPNWNFFKERLENRDPWLGEFKDPNGVSSVGAGQWIQSAGWFVISAQPQSEAYAKTSTLKWQGYFWVVVSVIGLGIFGYFWLRHISVPITKLAGGVVNVTRRKFDIKVPENFGLEEFRALGQAFNQMTTELQVYNDMQVEKIVDEKTKVEAILYSIRDGIVMVDDKGNLIFSNDTAKQWVVDVAGRGKDPFEKSWQSLQEYPPWMDVLQPVLDNEKATGLAGV